MSQTCYCGCGGLGRCDGQSKSATPPLKSEIANQAMDLLISQQLALDPNAELRAAIRKEERERAAEIANKLAQSHSKGGFSALGFNIAIAILGE